jgi:hypothetical protein
LTPTRWTFTEEQQKDLLALGLHPEQVQRLKLTLPSIGWRCARGPGMQDVRDKLSDLVKPLRRAEKLYVRLSTSRILASAEARERLYLAQETLKVGLDALHDSLESASKIVNRALDDLPRTRRSTRRNTAEFVRLIHKALAGGHAEHFVNRGKPMPPFLITVTRKRKPFPEIARMVSEASGGWGVDDAIRAYLNQRGGKFPLK